jgi:hypothetical protein
VNAGSGNGRRDARARTPIARGDHIARAIACADALATRFGSNKFCASRGREIVRAINFSLVRASAGGRRPLQSDAMRSQPPPTVRLDAVSGNALFETAVRALALDDATTRWLFVAVLNTIGATPAMLTPEELGNLLPELDRRLRKLVPEAAADAALQRLRRVLFDHATDR